MQKYLLTLAVAAMAAGSMMAEDVTLEVSAASDFQGTFTESTYKAEGGLQAAAHYQPIESMKIGQFSFTFGKEEGASSDPAVYMTEDGKIAQTVRLYKSNKMTITLAEDIKVGSITWNMKSVKGLDNVTVSSGEASVDVNAKTVVWNNSADAKSVTFTLPADKGSDGQNPNIQITSFVVSGEGVEIPEPIKPDPITSGYIYEGLVNSCDWTFENTVLPEGLNYVWKWDSSYNYLKGSAYNKQAFAAEAWAVSPVVDLTGVEGASVDFEHAAKFQTNIKELCGFYVREEGGEWTQLTIANWPEKDTWTFVSAGAVNLDSYVGKKIQFGLKYGSAEESADTWEIKNFRVSDPNGVAIVADENAPAVYFDLNGRRVVEPANGLFIKVQGTKASKVIIK